MGKGRTLNDVVGANLRDLRLAASLSQEGIARLMSEVGFRWHRQTVGQVEGGKRPVAIDELVALCAIFEVPLRGLLLFPSSRFTYEAVEVGAREVSVGGWANVVIDPRTAPFEEPADELVQRGIDEIVGGLDRPWAREWRALGTTAPDAYEAARDEVLAKRGRLPGPIYVTTSETPATTSAVRSLWGQSVSFTLYPGVPYIPRDDAEAAALEQIEESGLVRRITRQEAYRLRHPSTSKMPRKGKREQR